MSCVACQNVFSSRVEIEPQGTSSSKDKYLYFRSHYRDISGLCTAALNGCRICNDIWRYFYKEKTPKQYTATPYFETGEVFHHVYLGSGTSYRFREVPDSLYAAELGDNAVLLEFSLNSPLEKEQEQQGYTYVLQQVDDATSWHSAARAQATSSGVLSVVKVSPDVFDRKRWDLVHEWRSKCSKHTVCSARRSAVGFLPTRVVHVPYGPVTVNPHFYLVDTTKAPVWGGHKYVTLSHCWGQDKNPSYRTTAQNCDSRLKIGIPWRNLPLTFQDAIAITRRLRVSYLWIDSLCIIQGDESDWAKESSKMAHVYTNSTLNLSATSASSSQDGLNSSFETHPRFLRTVWSGELQPGWYRLIDLHYWQDRVADVKLNTRGWVLQERVLAPSVLHFTFDQLAWECCELVASEEFPDGLPIQLLDDNSTLKQNIKILRPALDRHEIRKEAFDFWQQAVTMYGRCDLTEPLKDKLIAISGLAKIIQERLKNNKLHGNGHDYLAGLWRGNLLGDLLWKVDRTRRFIHGTTAAGMYSTRWGSSARSTKYRAPSWSWASVDGLVQARGYLDVSGRPNSLGDGQRLTVVPRAEILQATTVLKDPDNAFGQVTSGRLYIRGRVYGIARRLIMYMTYQPFFRSTGESIFDVPDQPIDWSVYDQAFFLPLVQMTWTWDLLSPHKEELDKLLSTTLVLDLQSSSSPDEKSTKRSSAFADTRHVADLSSIASNSLDLVVGLMLSPNDDHRTWSRVGLLEVVKSKIDRVDQKECIPPWNARSLAAQPDEALRKGTVIEGSFAIV